MPWTSSEILLYQLPRAWDLPNPSHFCCKLETYLRMASVPYDLRIAYPFHGPKGKVPFIEDGKTRIGDTRAIIEHLKSRLGDPVDAWMTESQKTKAILLQRLLEEHLYWASMYERHATTRDNWNVTKRAICNGLPFAFKPIAAALHRRSIVRQLRGHGLGRLSRDQITGLANEDLDAVSLTLGRKSFMLGDRPASIDATAFGFLVNIFGCPIDSPIREHAVSLDNIVRYIDRMFETYFPELYSNYRQLKIGAAS